MKANQYSRKKFLAFLLSTLMLTSTALGFSACGGDSSSSSSSSSSDDTSNEEYVDTDVLKNAGFENFNDNEGRSPISTSPASWSIGRDSDASGTATVSNSASGIVDTKTAKWDTLTQTYVENAYDLTEAQVAEKWKDMSTRDKLEYYRDWKADDDNDNRTISNLSFYESFNIDDEDLPVIKNDQDNWVGLENPRTWDWTDASETDEEYDSRVLMLHNNVSKTNYIGSAYKATSQSTITLKAGTSAKLSLWVKTMALEGNLPSGADETSLVDLGAYIQISHTVGGATLDPIEVKNINTSAIATDNGWVQYEFFLRGSYYVDSTFTVVLGLGHGGSQDRYEYVNGFAFFDDVQCEFIDTDEYNSLITSVPNELSISSTKEQKIFSADLLPLRQVAMNFYGVDGDFSEYDLFANPNDWTIAPTTENNKLGTRYTAVEEDDIAGIFTDPDNRPTTYKGLGFDTQYDKFAIESTGVQALNGTTNKFWQAAYDKAFKDTEFLKTDKALILLSADGVNYTAKSPLFPVEKGERMLLSFFVKTSAMQGFTGATVTLNDGTNKHSFSSIDTTTVTPTQIGDTDIFEGWQQCLFFIHNDADDKQFISLTFNFGLTNIVSTTASSYREGFAVFSGFTTKSLDKTEFGFGADSTYSKVVTLSGAQNDGTGDNGFDTATNLQSANIKDGYALPQNYLGVYSNSAYVNSTYTDTSVNANTTAGLLNKKYAEKYATEGILDNLDASGTKPEDKWNSVFGAPVTATQPLVIYNDPNNAITDKAYGFIGTTTQTISANSYKSVSLRVKTSAGATAGIYLVDMKDTTRTSTLSIARNQTYWYDANGNVCDIDPTDKEFDKNVNVAFNKNANGLYTIDPDWTKKGDISSTTYYANLLNYKVDEDGNLLIADNGVSYDYSDRWQHEGNNGIAFYGYDAATKTAYADKDKTVKVYDFSTVTDLPARYEKLDAKQTNFFEITTGGEWAEVNFFIHAGSEAKTYRLEVWNGTRDNRIVNASGSYVLFDINHYSITAETFASNTELYKENLTEGEDYFESAFSFYDSAKFLRYNEELDENKVGDKYTEYDATNTTAYATHKASIAYLCYEDTTAQKYEIYTDYALTDTTVTVDSETDDSETDDGADDSQTEAANPMLLASSIAVAAVLILAIILIVVRKSVVAYRKKHGIYKK